MLLLESSFVVASCVVMMRGSLMDVDVVDELSSCEWLVMSLKRLS